MQSSAPFRRPPHETLEHGVALGKVLSRLSYGLSPGGIRTRITRFL